MSRSRPRGVAGLALVVTLLLVGAFSAIDPSSAFACTPVPNPDGTFTCGQTYSDIPCPSATGAGNEVGPVVAAEFIPADATNIVPLLSFSPDPPCQNASVQITYNTNASTPAPGPGQRTVSATYTIICNSDPCGPGTNPTTSFTVVFNEPSVGGGGSGGSSQPTTPQAGAAPPPAGAVTILTPADVSKGQGLIHAHLQPSSDSIWDLGNFTLLYLSGAAPRLADGSAGMSKVRRVSIGTIPSVTATPGTSVSVPFRLNKRGVALLSRTGKLRVTVAGEVSNTAGSTPFSARIKLVQGKK